MNTRLSRLPHQFAIASAIALGLCGAAFAQAPSGSAQPMPQMSGHESHGHGEHKGHGLARLDKDGDKMISREEAKGHPRLEKDFDAIDTNKDGKLSHDEMKAFREKMHAQRHAEGKHGADKPADGKPHDHHARAEEHFQKLDANKDGKLSKDEVKGQPMLEQMFDRIDANKDGFITREELKAAHEARKAERMKKQSEPGK